MKRATPSTAAIARHPLHPMLVNFPIAFLTAALATDLAFWWRGDAFWAEASYWLLLAGLVMGVVAALAGLVDFLTVRDVRRHVSAWSHMLAGIMVLALAAANTQLRWADPVAAALPWGLLLSLATAVLVAVAGWIGGTLTFKHGIGTYEDE